MKKRHKPNGDPDKVLADPDQAIELKQLATLYGFAASTLRRILREQGLAPLPNGKGNIRFRLSDVHAALIESGELGGKRDYDLMERNPSS